MLYRLLWPLGIRGRAGTGGGCIPSPLTLPIAAKLEFDPRCEDIDRVVDGEDRLPRLSVDDDLLNPPGCGNTLPFSELLLDSSEFLFLSDVLDLRRMLRWSLRKDGMFAPELSGLSSPSCCEPARCGRRRLAGEQVGGPGVRRSRSSLPINTSDLRYQIRQCF